MNKSSRRDSTPLGTRAKHSSTRENVNPKDIATKARFKIQRKAQKLLPRERIAECMRKPIPEANFVAVWRNPETEGAGFINLKTCDSYSCPVCANKRAEMDRQKLSVAMAQAQLKGLHPVMITFTMSHMMGMKLRTGIDALKKTFDAVFSGGWYQNLKDEYGIVGKVKAWESTHGKNGWHPHIHLIVFMTYELSDYQIAGLHKLIAPRFVKALSRRGFNADTLHGVDIRTAQSDIADYIAKFGREPHNKTWGADSEIARIPAKKAALSGMTPFDILSAADGDTDALGRLAAIYKGKLGDELVAIAEELYIEYFYAMKRCPRIVWSDGLKELLDLDAALEAVQLESPDIHEKDEIILMIPVGENWQKVIGRYNTADLRGELLALVRECDRLKIIKFLGDNDIQCILM